MEKKDVRMGRPKTAMEPAVYVGVTKTCPFCSSVDVEFKFLNNNKEEQPRYRCVQCKKLFTYNPGSRRRRHPKGYLKIASSDLASQKLPDNATVSCLNPSCGKVGNSRFLFFNNGKVTQPRYKCGDCGTTFTHGGRLSVKRKRRDLPDVSVHSTAGELVRLKRQSEESMQSVGENSEHVNVRSSDDTCGIEAIAQPKILRNTKKIRSLKKYIGISDGNEDDTTEISTTLNLCNWCESTNRILKVPSCALLDYRNAKIVVGFQCTCICIPTDSCCGIPFARMVSNCDTGVLHSSSHERFQKNLQDYMM